MRSSWTQWEEAKRARSSPLLSSQVFLLSVNYSATNHILLHILQTNILIYPRKCLLVFREGCALIASFVTELGFDRNVDDSLRNDAHHLPCDEHHLSPRAFRPSSGRLPAISQKWNEILLMESVISREAHLSSFLNSTTWRWQKASAMSGSLVH